MRTPEMTLAIKIIRTYMHNDPDNVIADPPDFIYEDYAASLNLGVIRKYIQDYLNEVGDESDFMMNELRRMAEEEDG